MKCRWLNSGAVTFISSRVKPAVLFFIFLICLKVQLSWYVAIKIKCTEYENTILKHLKFTGPSMRENSSTPHTNIRKSGQIVFPNFFEY
jgi:hypothetical protein